MSSNKLLPTVVDLDCEELEPDSREASRSHAKLPRAEASALRLPSFSEVCDFQRTPIFAPHASNQPTQASQQWPTHQQVAQQQWPSSAARMHASPVANRASLPMRDLRSIQSIPGNTSLPGFFAPSSQAPSFPPSYAKSNSFPSASYFSPSQQQNISPTSSFLSTPPHPSTQSLNPFLSLSSPPTSPFPQQRAGTIPTLHFLPGSAGYHVVPVANAPTSAPWPRQNPLAAQATSPLAKRLKSEPITSEAVSSMLTRSPANLPTQFNFAQENISHGAVPMVRPLPLSINTTAPSPIALPPSRIKIEQPLRESVSRRNSLPPTSTMSNTTPSTANTNNNSKTSPDEVQEVVKSDLVPGVGSTEKPRINAPVTIEDSSQDSDEDEEAADVKPVLLNPGGEGAPVAFAQLMERFKTQIVSTKTETDIYSRFSRQDGFEQYYTDRRSDPPVLAIAANGGGGSPKEISEDAPS